MNYYILPFFALAPSTIWLLFYLHKDRHPESKKMIVRVFAYGVAATIPAAALEVLLEPKLALLPLSPLFISGIYFFVVVGMTEEIFKYLAARESVFASSELDEPLDVMLYMIISALGFAALENLLYLLQQCAGEFAAALCQESFFQNSVALTIQRFVGATFLHALTSGTFGYFVALSFSRPKFKWIFFLAGLFLASVLHGLFNFSIMEVAGLGKLIIPVGILIGLAISTSWGFQLLKRMPNKCNI